MTRCQTRPCVSRPVLRICEAQGKNQFLKQFYHFFKCEASQCNQKVRGKGPGSFSPPTSPKVGLACVRVQMGANERVNPLKPINCKSILNDSMILSGRIKKLLCLVVVTPK